MKIATVIFCYNRTKYLEKMLPTINGKIDFAFIDYSPQQSTIREMIEDKVCAVVSRLTHLGLSLNIISGITYVFSLGYDAVIVLEDDFVLESNFFEYMITQLIMLQNDFTIGSVTGNVNNTGYRRFHSHGWGTWKNRWEKVNWAFEKNIDGIGFGNIGADLPGMYKRAREGKIDSWAVRFAYYHFKYSLLCYGPDKPLVKHIGIKGTNYNPLAVFGVRRHLRKRIQRLKVMRVKFNKLKEFWQLYKKWCREFDNNLQKAMNK